ncbi:MAG TPA: TnsA-like heteromeric transposase endonuclease subunit [Kineosporiaceae bacterium]|nr:TnsA-like heteromeric transposase endonuclease subunit [Kineosporiaceae bacterium]
MDGTGVVIDCRPADRINPRDAAAFEITRMACRGIGWDYILAGTPGPILAANVRWLAGYRHPRHAVTEVGDVLLEAFREQSPLMAGAHQVGDPIAVLPVLFHLIWAQQLVSDLTVPLDADIAVVARR